MLSPTFTSESKYNRKIYVSPNHKTHSMLFFGFGKQRRTMKSAVLGSR